ncbi:MAG: acyl-CoA dehydrogenase C-terminal domain-containing protein [Pseudomonadota bacterium]
MTTYEAPVRDMKFLLQDVLQIGKYSNLPGFSDASEDVLDAILEEGAKIARDVVHPLNTVGDKQGCVRNDDASVTTPKGFNEAYQQLVEGGWMGLTSDPDYGGQGLPNIVGMAWSEMLSSANQAFAMYPGLTHGAYAALHHHGTEEQKKKYLPKMVSGEWGGTMNLTEPHCGTDLGMLKSKAVPVGDGSYKISGQKIWISGGEHDMAENIVHLVLARIEGAPEGVKGISLFVAPKYFVNDDGSLGDRNGVSCGGLEEKMGIHGNSTCVMNYDEATGWLVGEENKGLKAMFVMMNEARIGTGMQGLGQASVAYQNCVPFAKDRIQGRSLTGPKNPDGPADPIIVHPDVRRMLMNQKAFVEGGRAFTFWMSLYTDLLTKSPDEEVRQKASDYLALLTPVLKAFLTDRGFKSCIEAQQVLGGSGFTQEWGIEQFVRDCRISMIYEGTNGVQALDLVGRKLMAEGGRYWQTYFKEIDEFVAENEGDADMAPFVAGLKSAKAQLEEATGWLGENAMKNFDHAGAGSTDYLQMFGLTTLAYMWAMMVKVSLGKIADGDSDPLYANKIKTGRYYVDRVLPEIAAHFAKLKTGADPVMALEEEAF